MGATEVNIGTKTEGNSEPTETVTWEDMDEVELAGTTGDIDVQEMEDTQPTEGVMEQDTDIAEETSGPVAIMDLLDPPPSYREAVSYENELEEVSSTWA